MVGRRTSTVIGVWTSWHPVYKFPTIRSAFENDRGLLNVPVGDAERPQDGVAVLQADDHVEPARLQGLADVGRRRPGLGVGVGVEDPDQLQPPRLGRPEAADEVAGVDGVGAGRAVGVGRRVDDVDPTVGNEGAGAEAAGQEPAGLVGQAVVAVADELEVLAPGQPQGRLPEAGCDPGGGPLPSGHPAALRWGPYPTAQLAVPWRAAWIARQTRSGEHGMSMWRTPRWATASTTAFCTAGVDPIVPDSPIPLAPNGLRGVGVSVWAVS